MEVEGEMDSEGGGLQWRGVRVDRAARVVRQADKVLAPQPPISDGSAQLCIITALWLSR